MIVVSDTGPINYLAQIGRGDLLRQLYGTVLVPQAVFAELTCAETPEPVRNWVRASDTVLEIRTITGDLRWPDLQLGEREALALALGVKADVILMDEKRGRRVAITEGLTTVGTLGILVNGAELGLLSLPEAIEKLRNTSFRMSDELVKTVLASFRSE